MASELSPHERDVVRLRLGLDDGVTRTVREVVEFCGGSVSISGTFRLENVPLSYGFIVTMVLIGLISVVLRVLYRYFLYHFQMSDRLNSVH